MSLFSKKKKVEENKEEVKSHIVKHKVMDVLLTPAYGDHRPVSMTAKDLDSFDELKETIEKHLGVNYVFAVGNGAYNFKFYSAVTFQEREVEEFVIDE